MKIQIWNFTIEEDRNGFILEEYGDKINPKDWTTSYGLKEQLFPATLDRCFIKILHKLKLDKTETFELEEYIEQIKKINNDFLEQIKDFKTLESLKKKKN